MQIIITDHGRLKSRVLSISLGRLALWSLVLLTALVTGISYAYHLTFTRAVEQRWTMAPVMGPAIQTMVQNDVAQRDRYLRENLDAMARRLGEMQARLVQLETIGDRVSNLAGLKPEEIRPVVSTAGSGGLLIDSQALTLEQLASAILSMDESTQQSADMFTVIESRLSEQKLRERLVPSERPVGEEARLGSGFGFRRDPISGRNALHTGLDFPAPVGTPIFAAAGGVVAVAERHPAYGLMIDLDHGNGLVTRYAHASRLKVKVGDLVKPGDKIAAVGSTGRSTGPHLHFEVLVDGVPQNPMKFLAGDARSPQQAAASARRPAR